MSDTEKTDTGKPVEGDSYECTSCGMKILVTTGCSCEDGAPFFSCCNQEMAAAGSSN